MLALFCHVVFASVLVLASLVKPGQNVEYLKNENLVCSDEGLTLETSAFQSLYGGQFTLSTPLINQIFVFHSPTDAAPQFLQKLTLFTHL